MTTITTGASPARVGLCVTTEVKILSDNELGCELGKVLGTEPGVVGGDDGADVGGRLLGVEDGVGGSEVMGDDVGGGIAIDVSMTVTSG